MLVYRDNMQTFIFILIPALKPGAIICCVATEERELIFIS